MNRRSLVKLLPFLTLLPFKGAMASMANLRSMGQAGKDLSSQVLKKTLMLPVISYRSLTEFSEINPNVPKDLYDNVSQEDLKKLEEIQVGATGELEELFAKKFTTLELQRLENMLLSPEFQKFSQFYYSDFKKVYPKTMKSYLQVLGGYFKNSKKA